MKKYILFLFLGATIIANAQILNVPEIEQEQTEWCWVGVSKCVLDYYGFPFQQCEIAEYARSVITWHNFGSTNCCQDVSQGCNYWNYNYGYGGSIQDILVHFGSISNNGRASSLSISEIQSNLNQNRPFIVRWAWTYGGGHFVVGYGIQGNNIYYMDPWFGEGYKISTYENLKNDGLHKWEHTNVITVSPDLSNIESIAIENVDIFPNPVKDELRVEGGDLTIKKVEILEITGKTIYQFNDLKNQINVSALPQGIYFVKIETNKGIVTKKFIKE